MEDYNLESRGIAYRSNGVNPGKKTLVFVHGLSGSASAWQKFEKQFEKDFNLITFDLRGHGLSVRPRHYSGYALGEFVEDLNLLLQELRVGRFYFIAHSFGALVARDYIAHYPGEVTGAVFLAAPYRLWSTWHHFAAWSAFVFRALCELWPLPLPRGRRLDYSGFHYSPDWDISRIAPDIYQMGVRSYLRGLCRQYEDRDEGWEKVVMPSTLVHGTADSFVPVSQAQALAKLMPYAKLKLVDGANHMLVINNVEEVCLIIGEFCALD